jgi:hypothetical protein
MSLERTVIFALTLALASCLSPFMALPVLYTCPILSLGWAVTACYAFVKYGKRAWPTALGAPLVLWWPFVFAKLVFGGFRGG